MRSAPKRSMPSSSPLPSPSMSLEPGGGVGVQAGKHSSATGWVGRRAGTRTRRRLPAAKSSRPRAAPTTRHPPPKPRTHPPPPRAGSPSGPGTASSRRAAGCAARRAAARRQGWGTGRGPRDLRRGLARDRGGGGSAARVPDPAAPLPARPPPSARPPPPPSAPCTGGTPAGGGRAVRREQVTAAGSARSSACTCHAARCAGSPPMCARAWSHVHGLGLADAVHARHGLQVALRVPVCEGLGASNDRAMTEQQ